ncbi:hypothetical protein E4U34_003470 [Claviceps purpurea]|nr:hypothetical protein E4U34_003470 [Claviceps purpurea]KAG6257658.1 hypothetical protein E4U23_002327 [Claviceps purpurea]
MAYLKFYNEEDKWIESCETSLSVGYEFECCLVEARMPKGSMSFPNAGIQADAANEKDELLGDCYEHDDEHVKRLDQPGAKGPAVLVRNFLDVDREGASAAMG